MKELRSIHIQKVAFKREASSNLEQGIIINEGSGPIIDMDGKIVSGAVWQWYPRSYHFSAVIVEVETN